MKFFPALALAFVCCTALNANAASDDAREITVRAVQQNISRDIVSSIAANADSREISADERAAGATVIEVIERLCGSLQDGYIDELKKANGMIEVSLDMPVNIPNAPSRFPACLYVYDAASVKKSIDIVVQDGDSAAMLFERLTGKKPDNRQLAEYFGLPLDKLSSLHSGDILRPKYITQPVIFTVSGPDVAIALANDIRADRGVNSIDTTNAPKGEIIVPIEAIDARFAGKQRATCEQASAALNGPEIARALAYSKGLRKPTMEVDVMVVDNGFMGADPNDGMFEKSPFDARFFRYDPNGSIAKAFDFVEIRLPITVRGDSQDRAIYGHGTHVAGLALGGPYFPARGEDKWPAMAQSLRLTVLNIADASNLPFDGAPKAISDEISETTPWIVNMSLAYNGVGSDPRADGVRTTFPTLIQTRRLALFVVAAGNDSGDIEVRRVYPAFLGGESAENVVTVAALDGNGRIAAFSNKGKKVDIAAPGCMIESWTDNTSSLTPLSGTSQAAPIVTFVSAMVRHLLPRAKPIDLKARLIASGDLLEPEDRGATAFSVKLGPAIAMYVFDDYVQKIGQSPMLGRIVRVDGLQCPPRSGDVDSQSVNTLWSIKRAGEQLFLFAGKDTDTLKPPCRAIAAEGAAIVFRPTRKLTSTGSDVWQGLVEITIPLREIANTVFASKER